MSEELINERMGLVCTNNGVVELKEVVCVNNGVVELRESLIITQARESHRLNPNDFEAENSQDSFIQQAGIFLLFAGSECYAMGGANDLKGTFDDLEEAVKAGVASFEGGESEWWHVFSTKDSKIMAGTYYQAYEADRLKAEDIDEKYLFVE